MIVWMTTIDDTTLEYEDISISNLVAPITLSNLNDNLNDRSRDTTSIYEDISISNLVAPITLSNLPLMITLVTTH